MKNILRIAFFIICLLDGFLVSGQPVLFESCGIGGGGATTQPSISPHNDSEYYITSDMSPILHSTNAGANFETIPFYELTGAGQHTRVEFTSDPNILYSFGYTGYPNPKEPLKSVDGGETWDVLSGDPTSGQVFQLFADPTTSSRIMLCDYRNIFISLDGGVTFSNIYHKDVNVFIGGVFWDGDDIYVAVNGASNNPNTGNQETEAALLVSNDGGQIFSQEPVNGDFPTGEYFKHMEGVKNDGVVTLYAVSHNQEWGGMLFTNYWGPTRKVLRLEYGNGSEWESISGEGTGMILASDSGNNTQDFHPNLIATCASAPDTLYVGGYSSPAMEVYRSIDGGDSWTKVFDADNANHNPNINTGWFGGGAPLFNWWWCGTVLGLDASNSNPDVVIITDMVSSHHSRDGGATWSALYVAPEDLTPMGTNTPSDASYKSNGVEITTSIDMLWISEDTIFTGYCDIQGLMSFDKGETWNFNYNFPSLYNSTYSMIFSPDSSKLYACVSGAHDMYGSTSLTDERIDSHKGEIFESSNGGMNWTTTHDFKHVVMDMAIDPNNPNRFYACVAHSTEGGIHYSDDYGSTWTLLPAPPRTEGHPKEIEILEDGTLVAVFSARYHDSQFTASSGIFISTDNGQTWEDRSDIGMNYWTMDVEIDPNNDSLWYASVKSHWGSNNSHQGGVYRSFNRGVSWERIKDFYRVVSVTIDPNNSNIAYVCTQDGRQSLQYTENIADENPTFSFVSSYPFAQPERVKFNPYNPNEIWVTSFGNGIRKGVVNEPVIGITLMPNQTTIIKENTEQLTVTIAPLTATNQNVSWSSTDNSIATVDENGLVTAVEQGNVTIIVTTEDGGFTDSCIVTVVEPVTGVTVTPNSATVIKGNTEQLIATITPLTATNQNVSWSSTDNSIATVDENGLVTAVEQGNVTIIVTTEDGGFTDSCIVTVVEPVTGIAVTPNNATVIKGNTEQLTATIAPLTATNKNLTWSSNNNNIAIVDENGLVTAVEQGNATIIVTTEDGGFTDSCIITVNNANGIDESDNEEIVTLYPNPVSGLLNIESNINMHKIEVFNFLGQLVDMVNLNSKNYQYNTEKLNHGYYLFKIKTKHHVSVKKVMRR